MYEVNNFIFHPRDYHLLGVQHQDFIHFNVATPFGPRSAVMMCQRTTSAVPHIFGNLGYQCINYIDDFGGAKSPSKATMAIETLKELFSILGLVSSPEKDSAPSTCMVFLGVQFNTIDMTMAVTPECLPELSGHAHLRRRCYGCLALQYSVVKLSPLFSPSFPFFMVLIIIFITAIFFSIPFWLFF